MMFPGLRSRFSRWLMPAPERRRFDLSQLVDDDVWEALFGDSHGSAAGEKITAKSALTIAPVWGAISMISGGCAKIPAKVYKRRSPGPGKDVDYNHQASQFIDIDEMANDETPAYELLRRWYFSALLHNVGYIWADWSPGGELLGLYNLLPDRTSPARKNGQLLYVTEVNGQLEPLHRDDVLVLTGIGHGPSDTPALLQQARHDFGLQLAARKLTSKFFANGAHLGGVLQLPPGYNPDTRKKYEKALTEQRTGSDKAFKTFVLGEGYKWFSTSVDPQKAMTIELNDEKRRDVANWFCIPGSFLGVKDSTSYNSEEAAKQAFFDQTLSNWLIPAQAQLNTRLRSPVERRTRSHVIRFQVSALLWTDAKTRHEIAVTGIQSGRFSPDETRNWDDYNPREDGEGSKFLRPLNMTVADATAPAVSPDPAAQDPNADARAIQMRDALAKLLESTMRRIAKRLHLHMERAAKADRLDAWRETFAAEHRAVVTEMLDDVLPAIRLASEEQREAGVIVDDLFAAVRTYAQVPTPAVTLPDDLARRACLLFFPELNPHDD